MLWRTQLLFCCASARSTRRARWEWRHRFTLVLVNALCNRSRHAWSHIGHTLSRTSPQACRTEAEYAFQQRKKIVPVLMEHNYKPSGWLGALMGTRLYFNMSEGKTILAKMPSLVRELGDDGRCEVKQSAVLRRREREDGRGGFFVCSPPALSSTHAHSSFAPHSCRMFTKA